ncbi:MAG TPA: hypothetical protein VMX16_03635 [Terriglobia bacterium]|nr:hypothetical protein [Terriglobia bacterium]
MKAWVFKINTRRGWEFRRYFASRRRRPFPMGDRGWIRSARSLRLIRDQVKRGDLFLCYEADRRLMVGMARAASDGRDASQGPLLSFCPPSQALRLDHPLTRHPDLDHVLAFTPQRGRGTIAEIARDELARIWRVILKKNSRQAMALNRLLAGGTGLDRER